MKPEGSLPRLSVFLFLSVVWLLQGELTKGLEKLCIKLMDPCDETSRANRPDWADR